jgi:hypothetical protein
MCTAYRNSAHFRGLTIGCAEVAFLRAGPGRREEEAHEAKLDPVRERAPPTRP